MNGTWNCGREKKCIIERYTLLNLRAGIEAAPSRIPSSVEPPISNTNHIVVPLPCFPCKMTYDGSTESLSTLFQL